VVGDDPYPFDAQLYGACLLGEATPNFQRLRLSVVVSGPQTLRILALVAGVGQDDKIALSGEMERAATGV